MSLLIESSPRIEQPTDCSVVLKKHQLACVAQMLQAEKKEMISFDDKFYAKFNFGILGETVGSGKTLIILTLAMMPKPIKDDIVMINNSHGCSTFENRSYLKNLNCTLIVIPHGLTKQWESELTRFYPSQKYVILSKANFEQFNKDIVSGEYNTEHKIVIAPNTVIDYDFIKGYTFNRVFYDEIDSIKLPSNREISTGFTWFVSATYKNLYTKSLGTTGYLRSLFLNSSQMMLIMVRKLYPSITQEQLYINSFAFWSRLVVRSHPSFLQESLGFNNQIKTQFIKCFTPQIINNLKGMISPDIIAALNANDYETVAAQLGCKKSDETSILESILSHKYDEIEKLEARITYFETINLDSSKLKEKLVTLQKSLADLETRLKSNTECPICYDDPRLTAPALTPCCKNWFCLNCITNSLKSRRDCPMCRTTIDINQLTVNDVNLTKKETPEEKTEKKEEKEVLSKDDTLINLIIANPLKKYLVFSDFSFNVISSSLTENNIVCSELKGAAAHIRNVLKKFEAGQIQVLLLNSKHQGAGHNITCADTIVLYHRLEQELEKQVIGRVYRLGKESGVDIEVVKLTHDNEYA